MKLFIAAAVLFIKSSVAVHAHANVPDTNIVVAEPAASVSATALLSKNLTDTSLPQSHRKLDVGWQYNKVGDFPCQGSNDNEFSYVHAGAETNGGDILYIAETLCEPAWNRQMQGYVGYYYSRLPGDPNMDVYCLFANGLPSDTQVFERPTEGFFVKDTYEGTGTLPVKGAAPTPSNLEECVSLAPEYIVTMAPTGGTAATTPPSVSPNAPPTSPPSLSPVTPPSMAPTTSPVISPTASPSTSLSLFVSMPSNGVCQDKNGNPYSEIALSTAGPFTNTTADAEVCSNYCSQNGHHMISNFVGFHARNADAGFTTLQCDCLFSGGLPSPLPNYNPSYNLVDSQAGTGPIDKVEPNSNYRCYVYKSATYAPTPSPTTAPTVSPSNAPTTASPSTSPTVDNLSLFVSMPSNGVCQDKNGNPYSEIALSTAGPFTNTTADAEVCSNYCSQNGHHMISNFVGFHARNADAGFTTLQCDCLFSGGLPSPLPNYNPSYTLVDSSAGTGPIVKVSNPNPNSNVRCYVYKSATYAPTPTPTTFPTLSPTTSPTADPTTSPSVHPSLAPTTVSPTISPTANNLPLFVSMPSNGFCQDKNGNAYSSVTLSNAGPFTNTTVDANVCSNYCSQNGNHMISNFVGFHATNADANGTTLQCDCLFSGGLPSPLPNYIPSYNLYFSQPGTGPINKVEPNPGFSYSCYVYKSATYAPTPSPTTFPTSSPSTSPSHAPTVAPTDSPTTSTPSIAPTVNNLSLFLKMPSNGVCQDKNKDDYSSIINSIAGPFTNTTADEEVCSNYCSQNGNHMVSNFVGFQVTNADAGFTTLQCDYLFSGGLPSPLPNYNPNHNLVSSNSGIGPISRVLSASNYRCYVYKSASYAPTPSPTTAPTVSPSTPPSHAPTVTPSQAPTFAPTSSPTTQGPSLSPTMDNKWVQLYNKVGDGTCLSAQNHVYSSISVFLAQTGDNAKDEILAVNYCTQRILPTYVGFEYIQFAGTPTMQVSCLFSGGLPSPLPVYSPASTGSDVQIGSGVITGTLPNPVTTINCYSYKAVGALPTYAPSASPVTSDPSVSPVSSPPSMSPVSPPPTVAPVLSASPTITRQWEVVGLGECVDIGGEPYSYVGAALEAGKTTSDCDAWCSQNRIFQLIGFVVNQMPTETTCRCQFNGGQVPDPLPTYTNPSVYFAVGQPGNGPIARAENPFENSICLRYITLDAPGTPAPTKAMTPAPTMPIPVPAPPTPTPPTPGTSAPIIGPKSAKSAKSTKSVKSAKKV